MYKILYITLLISLGIFTQSETIDFSVIIRDFRPSTVKGGHEDFQYAIADDRKVVSTLLNVDGLPTFVKKFSKTIHSKNSFFSWWYPSTLLNKRIDKVLTFQKNGDILTYDNQMFFPIDNEGWGNDGFMHNYHFTMQMHCNFTYRGGETFDFRGDDDVWVYINKMLAIDLGGCHGPESASVKLDDLTKSHGLVVGKTYDFDLFFAERHTYGSSIKITTSMVLVPSPTCDMTQDTDQDGVPDCIDNCPNVKNADQRDCNVNGVGDACDTTAGRLEFPYVATFRYNVNETASTDDEVQFGQSLKFDPLNSGTGITIDVTDPIPDKSIPDFKCDAKLFFKNSGTENCFIKFQFKSAVGASEIKTALITPGDVSIGRFFDLINNFYDFKFKPLGGDGKSISGQNQLMVESTSPVCNNKLSLGAVILDFRYTLPSNNETGYYSPCVDASNSCLYGTLRFGGYCACWSGAFGPSCVMDTAVYGNNTFPEIESQIHNAWSDEVPDITDEKVYFKLDLDSMAGKTFYRNWTNHPTCKSGWEKVYDLETGGVVSLDSAFFEDQALTIFVSQPFVDGRADGAVFLNRDDDTILPLIDCYYPRSTYIYKQVDHCRDIWKFSIPWESCKQCFWNKTESDSYLIYSGRIIVHNLEWVSIEQWRIIRSVLRLKIRFQRLISVNSTDVTVNNSKPHKFALTKQIVNADLNTPSLIEVGSILEWPSKIYNFSMDIFPVDKIAGVEYSKSDCVSNQGRDCRQSFRTLLTLTEGTCTLDGDYGLNFTVDCGEDVPKESCPLTGDDLIASVGYTLRSENFCAEITVDIGLVGNIRSYGNQSFDSYPEQTTFIVGRRIYYLIKVNSDINLPKKNGVPDADLYDESGVGTIVKFEKVELVKVTVKRPDGTFARIWENFAPVDYISQGLPDLKTDCQSYYTKNDGTALAKNTVGFSFVLTKSLIFIMKNSIATISVIADVSVTYTNIETKKRSSAQDKTTFTIENDVKDDGAGPIDTSEVETSQSGLNTNQNTETRTSESEGLYVSFILAILALFAQA